MSKETEIFEVNFDVLGEPAAPATPAPASKPAPEPTPEPTPEPEAPATTEVTDALVRENGLEEVLAGFFAAPGVKFRVTYRAWAGVRRGPKAGRMRGVRSKLRELGFEIVEKEPLPDSDGRLASAVYSDGSSKVSVTYNVSPWPNPVHEIEVVS